MLRPLVQKTFGGLSKQYYFRQLFFGLIVAISFFFVYSQGSTIVSILDRIEVILSYVLLTLLYPYSRFVYESIVRFILGDNIFFMNTVFMLILRFLTMTLCWTFSIVIAPIGLAYLYYHHSKSEKQEHS